MENYEAIAVTRRAHSIILFKLGSQTIKYMTVDTLKKKNLIMVHVL